MLISFYKNSAYWNANAYTGFVKDRKRFDNFVTILSVSVGHQVDKLVSLTDLKICGAAILSALLF